MAWGSEEVSTALTLTASYQTVQRSSADWEISLNPGETAVVIAKFNPEDTPADDLVFALAASNDGGTVFETDDAALSFQVANVPDPDNFMVLYSGPKLFRIRAKQDGGGDTTNSVVFSVLKNGVSL